MSWEVVKTIDVVLKPSEIEVGGWNVVKTIDIILEPSEIIAGEWEIVKTVDVTLVPPEVEPDEDGNGNGIVGWFERNKTLIIIVSAAVLVISIIVLATKRKVQFPVAAWPRFQPPIVKK